MHQLFHAEGPVLSLNAMLKASGNKKFVLVDIDGTIADVRHRLHHLQPGRKNWSAFFAAMDRDQPVPDVLENVRKLSQKHRIVIVTGRPEDYRARTEHWLRSHNVPFERVFMRRTGDHRPDYIAKSEVLNEIPASEIALAIDDRAPVCEMYERAGIKCWRVESNEQNQQEVNEVYRQKSEVAP